MEKEIIRDIHNERGNRVGWYCDKCKTSSPFLSQLQHFKGCDAKTEVEVET